MRADGLNLLQIARFCIVGLLATVIHVCLFAVLIEWFLLPAVYSVVPAFVTATVFGFYMNRFWTFNASQTQDRQLLKYFIVAIVGLGLNVSITFITVDMLDLWYGIAIGLIVLSVPTLTYLMNRYWTFSVQNL